MNIVVMVNLMLTVCRYIPVCTIDVSKKLFYSLQARSISMFFFCSCCLPSWSRWILSSKFSVFSLLLQGLWLFVLNVKRYGSHRGTFSTDSSPPAPWAVWAQTPRLAMMPCVHLEVQHQPWDSTNTHAPAAKAMCMCLWVCEMQRGGECGSLWVCACGYKWLKCSSCALCTLFISTCFGDVTHSP